MNWNRSHIWKTMLSFSVAFVECVRDVVADCHVLHLAIDI